MAQQNAAFVGLASAVAAGGMAKAASLPDSFAGALAVAAFGVCVAAKSFLKVEIPEPQPKPRKISKKEKKAAAAAAKKSEPEPEDPAKLAKQARKREKERARKEAKRAAKKAEEEAAEAKEVAEEEKKEVEKKLSKEEAAKAKKKKQKEKQKAKKAAKAASSGAVPETKVEPAQPTEPTEPSEWEEVKQKKGKKKVETEVVASEEPEHITDIYVERKYFGMIIGPGGANLRAIISATGVEIDLPKEGGIRPEIVISGPKKGCFEAKEAIEQLVKKGYSKLTHAGTSESSIAIPDNKRGAVIGSKGSILRVLQDKLSVKVNFPDKGSDEEVTVVGEPANVAKALQAIRQLLEDGFSSFTHEGYIKVGLEVPRDMLRNLIGASGSTIKTLQSTYKVQINISSERSGELCAVAIVGEAADVARAREEIAVLMVPPEPKPIDPLWSQAASAVHVDVW